jgi:hypothetical protein
MTINEYFPRPLHLEPMENGHRWLLVAPFEFVDGVDFVHVPAGFVSDLNSVPRVVWWWFPKTESPAAGLVHDFLYRYPGKRTREQVDKMHLRILELLGVRKSKRMAAYYGIRIGSGGAWTRYRADEFALRRQLIELQEKARKRKEDA